MTLDNRRVAVHHADTVTYSITKYGDSEDTDKTGFQKEREKK